jgi:hypothetical protein
VGACGCVWVRVGACGCVWVRVGACGCVWVRVWVRVGACGCVWVRVGACGCVRASCILFHSHITVNAGTGRDFFRPTHPRTRTTQRSVITLVSGARADRMEDSTTSSSVKPWYDQF